MEHHRERGIFRKNAPAHCVHPIRLNLRDICQSWLPRPKGTYRVALNPADESQHPEEEDPGSKISLFVGGGFLRGIPRSMFQSRWDSHLPNRGSAKSATGNVVGKPTNATPINFGITGSRLLLDGVCACGEECEVGHYGTGVYGCVGDCV
jgi:hypothetical protein